MKPLLAACGLAVLLFLRPFAAWGQAGMSLDELEKALGEAPSPTATATAAPSAAPSPGSSPSPTSTAATPALFPRNAVTPGAPGPPEAGPAEGVKLEPIEPPEEETPVETPEKGEGLLEYMKPEERAPETFEPPPETIESGPKELIFNSPPRINADFEAFPADWAEFRRVFKAGQKSRVREILEKMRERKEKLGIRNLPSYSAALIRLSFRMLDEDEAAKKGDAAELIGLAEGLSPTWSETWFAKARLERRSSPLTPWRAWAPYKKGFHEMAVQMRPLSRVLANGLYAFGFAVFFSLALFAAACLYRSLSPLSHELSHLFRLHESLGPRVAWWLAIPFCLLPILAGIGFFWLFCVWLVLTWPFLDRGSRITAYVVVFLVLAAAPVYLELMARTVAAPRLPGTREIIKVREEGWDDQTLGGLVEWVNDHPKDYLALFTVANLLRNGGNYDEAREIYTRAIRARPTFFPAFVNLGNLYARRAIEQNRLDSDLPLVEQQYKKALAIRPGAALVHYNLGRLFAFMGRRKESDAEIQKAMESDKPLVERLLEKSDIPGKSVVEDAVIPIESLWARLAEPGSAKRFFKETLWRGAILFFPLKYFFLLALGALALLALVGKIASLRSWAAACPDCGLPICQGCGTDAENQKVCAQCYNAIKKKESVDPRIRLNKMVEIKRYGDRRKLFGRVAAFLVPGGGHMMQGMNIRGFLFCIFCTTILIGALRPQGFIREELFIWPEAHHPGLTAAVVAGLVVYALSVLDYFREE